MDKEKETPFWATVRGLSLVMERRLYLALRPTGLTAPQYLALRGFADTPGSTSASVASGGNVTPQTATTITRQLEMKGYLERKQIPGEGRGMPGRVTPRGRAAIRRAEKAIESIEAEFLRASGEALPMMAAAALAALTGKTEQE